MESDATLSSVVFKAFEDLALEAGQEAGKATNPSEELTFVGFRVGFKDSLPWTIVGFSPNYVQCVSTQDYDAADNDIVDAWVSYRDERTFAALMDDDIGAASALALGKLRIKGSISAASASEAIYIMADLHIRKNCEGELRSDAIAAAETAAAEASKAEEASEAKLRRARALGRSRLERIIARHSGTDQQVGALLLVLGSFLYSVYCAAVVALGASQSGALDGSNVAGQVVCAVLSPREPMDRYLQSSLLWLVGSIAFVSTSYPEKVVQLVARAEADSVENQQLSSLEVNKMSANTDALKGPRFEGRLASLSNWDRWFGDSSLLLGAWGFGLGAIPFIAAACSECSTAAAAAAAGDASAVTLVVPLLYLVAGLYMSLATGIMVFSSLPANLAANGGAGSALVLTFFENSRTFKLLADAAITIARAEAGQIAADTNVQQNGSNHIEGNTGDSMLPFMRIHASSDLLAGTWAFALFMGACLIFGVVDALAIWGSTDQSLRSSVLDTKTLGPTFTEEKLLSLLFLVAQVPFTLGSVLLATASYPNSINRAASFWWKRRGADEKTLADESRDRVLDEMEVRRGSCWRQKIPWPMWMRGEYYRDVPVMINREGIMSPLPAVVGSMAGIASLAWFMKNQDDFDLGLFMAISDVLSSATDIKPELGDLPAMHAPTIIENGLLGVLL